MKVLLASCGNPDYRQDPDKELWGCDRNKWVNVDSIKEASEKCVAWIERNDLGAGNWNGGRIIAHISYNGRAWKVDNGIRTLNEIELS